jgi:hypothetical protein
MESTLCDYKDRIQKANKKLRSLNRSALKDCTCNIRFGIDEGDPCKSCRAGAELEEILDFAEC